MRLLYRIPARGLFGYRSEFLTDTRGTGIMHHRFLEYGPWAGPLAGRTRGTLVSMENGSGRRIRALQPAGAVDAVRRARATPVYEGMIIGENSRPGDMDVNPTKEKKLTNMRTKSSDENIQLEPPRELTLEGALEYIEDDELIEVTPQSIRLRKRFLSANDRKKLSREAKRERARAIALTSLSRRHDPCWASSSRRIWRSPAPGTDDDPDDEERGSTRMISTMKTMRSTMRTIELDDEDDLDDDEDGQNSEF